MLYDPARHEALTRTDWNADVAVQTIGAIARDAEAQFSAETHWPIHPLDAGGTRGPFFDLYLGAGGVVWALCCLKARGAVELRRSYADCVDALVQRNGPQL